MDWGFLQGLGAGMQELGGSVFKSKFLDKLKEEEEVRKESRAAQRLADKEATTPVSTQFLVNENGRQVVRKFNSMDKLVSERAATQTEIEEINHTKMQRDRAGQKEDLAIQKLTFEVDSQPEELEMKREAHARGLDQRDYSNQTSRISAERPSAGRGGGGIESALSAPIDNETTAIALLEAHKDLASSYTQGGDKAKLTRDIVERVARDVAAEQEKKAAAGVMIDVSSVFRDALSRAAVINASKRQN